MRAGSRPHITLSLSDSFAPLPVPMRVMRRIVQEVWRKIKSTQTIKCVGIHKLSYSYIFIWYWCLFVAVARFAFPLLGKISIYTHYTTYTRAYRVSHIKVIHLRTPFTLPTPAEPRICLSLYTLFIPIAKLVGDVANYSYSLFVDQLYLQLITLMNSKLYQSIDSRRGTSTRHSVCLTSLLSDSTR